MAPPGPGRRERLELEEARGNTEAVFLRAIAMEDRGYLRRHGTLRTEELSGAVWAILHGAAMLTIDEQWNATRLGGLDDPGQLAARTLRFLTTASSEAMKPAEEALEEAQRRRAEGPGEGAAAERAARHDLPQDDWFVLRESAAVLSERIPLSPPPLSPALRRARALPHLAEGARILWIDDLPGRTEAEARIFTALGAAVVRASSSREALRALEDPEFDVILSDIARPEGAHEGVRALPRIRARAPDVPVIFYVARLGPEPDPPPGAFGITNDPEELVHLVFDALERRRV